MSARRRPIGPNKHTDISSAWQTGNLASNQDIDIYKQCHPVCFRNASIRSGRCGGGCPPRRLSQAKACVRRGPHPGPARRNMQHGPGDFERIQRRLLRSVAFCSILRYIKKYSMKCKNGKIYDPIQRCMFTFRWIA